jgi:hypothetical protein
MIVEAKEKTKNKPLNIAAKTHIKGLSSQYRKK